MSFELAYLFTEECILPVEPFQHIPVKLVETPFERFPDLLLFLAQAATHFPTQLVGRRLAAISASMMPRPVTPSGRSIRRTTSRQRSQTNREYGYALHCVVPPARCDLAAASAGAASRPWGRRSHPTARP